MRLAARGVRETQAGLEDVADADLADRLRRKATAITLFAVAFGLLLTGVVFGWG